MKLTVSSLKKRDLASVTNLQPQGWLSIIPHLEYYISSNFCFPIKIEVDQKIVGIGTAIIHHDVAWLAHIIVHADYRNKGIGSAVTEKLLGSVKHCRTVSLIATTLGYPVYKKFGFITETEYINFTGDLILQTAPSTKPFENKYEDEIFSLDTLVTGEIRDRLLKKHLKDAKLIIDNHHVLGYYLPTLGEGLIIANTIKAGLELLTVRINQHNKTTLPENNKSGIELLIKSGMTEHSRVSRMYLGRKLTWSPEKIYSRIGGNMG